MDLQSRGQQPIAAPAAGRPVHTGGRKSKGKLQRVAVVVGVALVAVLIAALAVKFGLGGPKAEKEFVDDGKYQAVFLNGGQVYFGKIGDLNSQYLTLSNIYYLRVNEQVQPDADAAENAQQDISLAKLGCELHGPQDQMVINRDQITFWENLKDDGQVAKAIAQFLQQNPDGQKCTAPQAQQ